MNGRSVLATLEAALAAWPLPAGAATPLAVGFSGGLDSTVLLAAAVRLGRSVRALHVNHGLAAQADAWQRHCERVAAELGVDFVAVRVAVEPAGRGTEAAAREARYRALRELVRPGEVLLTAHHADDQLETLLLRMMRGTGVRGLRGALPFTAFGRGFLGRPLLELPRAKLAGAAREWGLEWLEDPANAELRFDRNWLRTRVLPALRERWPAAPELAARLAAQMRDAESILEDVARSDAAGLARLDRIPAATLAALSPPRQRNLLRYALRALEIAVPSAEQLERVRTAAASGARPDARVTLRWPGGEARLYRAHLYLLAPLPPQSAPGYRAEVRGDRFWCGPEGRLGFAPAEHGVPAEWVDEGLTLAFRVGGERFKPAGARHSVSLKHWLQQRGVVPWMRDRIPLLYRGDRLIAVADLALADEAAAAPGAERRRVVWTDHPPLD